jgi:hypothetical protein
MRNSSGGPLTLSAWQRELVMSWVNALEQLVKDQSGKKGAFAATTRPLKAAAKAREAAPAAKPLSEEAARRQEEVMERINAGDDLTM